MAVTGDTTGQLTIFPKQPSQLGAGTFTDTITVRACLDNGCFRQIGGSPKTINVTYTVRSITATPTSVTLTGIEGVASNVVTLNVQNSSGSPDFTTQVSYTSGADGWLTVTPASGSSATATLSLQGLPNNQAGQHAALLRILAGGIEATVLVIYNVAPNVRFGTPTLAFNAVSTQAALPPAANVDLTATAATTYTTTINYGGNGSIAPLPIGSRSAAASLRASSPCGPRGPICRPEPMPRMWCSRRRSAPLSPSR